MIIEPRVRGFICTTAHPVGCATNVREQIAYVLRQGAIPECPKRVAVVGCSTGYGLASRIVATFAGGADTIGVSMEREPSATKSGSAGWYNNRAFELEAGKVGRAAVTLEGDGFSDELKKTFIDRVREKFGQLDMLVYSMAAPVRTDPDTGKTYRSAIKPLGNPVEPRTHRDIRAGAWKETAHQSAIVETGAADENRPMAACVDAVDRRHRVAHVACGSVFIGWLDDVDEVMRNSAAFGHRHLVGADIETPIHRRRVATDDLAAVPQCQFDAQRALPRGSRTQDGEDRRAG